MSFRLPIYPERSIIERNGDQGTPTLVCAHIDTVWLLRGGDAPSCWIVNQRSRSKWLSESPKVDSLLISVEKLEQMMCQWRCSLARRLDCCSPEVPNPFVSRHFSCEPDWELTVHQKARAVRKFYAHIGAEPPFPNGVRPDRPRLVELRFQQLLFPGAAARDPDRLDHIRRQEERARFLRKEIAVARKFRWWREWLDSLPPIAHEALCWMDKRDFRTHRWRLLRLWMKVPEATDLYRSFPQIAWVLADPSVLAKNSTPLSTHEMRSLTRKPIRETFDRLGLPARSTCSLLRRIPPHDLDDITGSHLATILPDAEPRHLLLNLPGDIIPPVVLQILASPDTHPISYPILRQISEGRIFQIGNRIYHLEHIYQEARIAAGQGHEIEIERQREELRRIESPKRLYLFLRSLEERNRQHAESTPPRWQHLIRPPIPPADWMSAVETRGQLVSEGKAMKHCVADYEERIATGYCYIYTIHHPGGRATLAVSRSQPDSSDWRVADLQGPCNKAVPQSVVSDVHAWLERNQSS